MITSDYQQQIETFKETQIRCIEEFYRKNPMSEYAPILFILAKNTADEGFTICPTMFPFELFNSGHGKDLLTKVLIPGLLRKLEAEGQVPICINWTMEVWYRNAKFDSNDERGKRMAAAAKRGEIGLTKEEYESLPKQEGIMVIFETEFSSESLVWELHRSPGHTRLVKKDMGGTEFSGRFSNLFRKVPSKS